MDLYQIFITHNRAWTIQEVVSFICLFLIALMVSRYLVRRGRIQRRQAIAGMVALTFLAVVFASTVFTRASGLERQCELTLFWSWREVFLNQNMVMLKETLLNCILLLPFGLLWPLIRNKKVRAIDGFMTGFLISAVIEICQWVLRRGLFEWDDMIHNGLGCLLGCLLMNWWMDRKK